MVQHARQDMVDAVDDAVHVHLAHPAPVTKRHFMHRDAMHGDATLFARQDVVEAAWAVVDGVLNQPLALHTYDVGSVGPAEAAARLERRAMRA